MARTKVRIEEETVPVTRKPRRPTEVDTGAGTVFIEEKRKLSGPSTGQVMMRLRKIVSQESGEPWHAVIKIRPLTEEVDTAFQIYVRLPNGSTEWFAEYTPEEADDDVLSATVKDILRMRQDAKDAPTPTVTTLNEDGEVVPTTTAKRRQIVLANGNTIEVKVRAEVPAESETNERIRLQKEMDSSQTVIIMMDRDDCVVWNGMFFPLKPGPNTVPKHIADIWFQSVTDTRKAHWRMGVALNEAQTQAWLDSQRNG